MSLLLKPVLGGSSSSTSVSNQTSDGPNMVYRFIHNGKIGVRVLQPDQAGRVREIFQQMTNDLHFETHVGGGGELVDSSDGSTGLPAQNERVTNINLETGSIEVKSGQGEKRCIKLIKNGEIDPKVESAFQKAVNELQGILKFKKMDGGLAERQGKWEKCVDQKDSLVLIRSSYLPWTSRVDIQDLGFAIESKNLQDSLKEKHPKNKEKSFLTFGEEVFKRQLKDIKVDVNKKLKKQELTDEKEQMCKREARRRACAVMMRHYGDVERIELYQHLTK
ncbi:MAG: hypothetical protein EBU93_08145, partial [Chlamydiae bacterium]|nr:hypothetical protein [Chlamydiota bacterium]